MEEEDVFVEHALLNSLVLSKIFGILDAEGSLTVPVLKQLRLVSKIWYQETMRKWKSVTELTPRIRPDPTPGQENDIINRRTDLISISDFFAIYGNPNNDLHQQMTMTSFKSYLLSGFTLTSNDMWTSLRIDEISSSILDNFWNTVGSLVEHISFENCTFPGDNTQIFRMIVGRRLPNLTRLTLVGNRTVPQRAYEFTMDETYLPQLIVEKVLRPCLNQKLKIIEVDGETPIGFHELILDSLNLESLKVRNDSAKELDFPMLLNLWSVLPNYGGVDIPIKLKNLDVMNSFYFSETFNRYVIAPMYGDFDGLQVPLERLTMDLGPHRGYHPYPAAGVKRPYISENNNEITNSFIPMLEGHAETLRVVHAFRPPVFPCPTRCPFQVEMPCMTELYIWGSIVTSFSFLRYVPNLEILYVNPFCYDKMDQMQEMFFPKSTNMQLDEFGTKYRPVDRYIIKNTRFSNAIQLNSMKHLHLDVHFYKNSFVVKIFSNWMPNLKIFKANLGYDEFRSVCKRMPNLEELVGLYQSQLDDQIITGLRTGKERNPYNITCLKSLKRFELKQDCKAVNFLGDQSVYQGFLQIKSLKSLCLRVSEEFMSNAAQEAARLHIPNVTFIRSPHHFNDHECCKKYGPMFLKAT